MPGSGLKHLLRCACQSPTGTIVLPSLSPTSWAVLHSALLFTTDANSSRDDTAWRLNACLTRPKHQSGANLVCPEIRKFSYWIVQTDGHSPCTIPQYNPVLVLPWAVVAMEVDIGFPQAEILKEIMQVWNHRISSLTDEMSLVNQKVHLLRNPLAAHTKQATLTWHQEINRSRLLRITRQVNLLRVVETVVHGHWVAHSSAGLQLGQPIVPAHLPRLLHHCVVYWTLSLHSLQMVFLRHQSFWLLPFRNVSASKTCLKPIV